MKPYLRIVQPDDPWQAHLREARAVEKRSTDIARMCAFFGFVAWLAFLGWAAVS
jgi:hypothetical protein